jgi:anti-anti-sigma regulatory factor
MVPTRRIPSMQIVTIPRKFNESAVHKFTAGFVSQSGEPLNHKIVFDFGSLDFIDGTGFTMLCNAIEWLAFNGCEILFRGHGNETRQGIIYLDRCGFFQSYIGNKLSLSNRPLDTAIPCISVTHANAHGWIHSTLSPWLCRNLNVNDDRLPSIRTLVKEIFNNIADHSTCNTGFIHVQHYPNIRQIRLTVSDFGQGIPSTMRRSFGYMKDSEAIFKACQEGVTSKSKPTNMGAGLNYVIDVVLFNQGRLAIHSYNGGLNCVIQNGKQKRSPFAGNGTYPGTLLDITLDTRTFLGDESDDVGTVEWI